MTFQKARNKILESCKGFDTELDPDGIWVLYVDPKDPSVYNGPIALDESDILGMSINKEELELQLTYLKVSMQPDEAQYLALDTLSTFISDVNRYTEEYCNSEWEDRLEEELDEAKVESYDEGHEEGYTEGYDEGFDAGKAEGHADGFDEGYTTKADELEEEDDEE